MGAPKGKKIYESHLGPRNIFPGDFPEATRKS